jgi:hypothetical protein
VSAPLPPRVLVMRDGSRWVARAIVRSGPRSYAVEADGETTSAALAALADAIAVALTEVQAARCGNPAPEVIA